MQKQKDTFLGGYMMEHICKTLYVKLQNTKYCWSVEIHYAVGKIVRKGRQGRRFHHSEESKAGEGTTSSH